MWNVDPSKISTVLNNLLDNAVAFTPSGGCIEVSIRPHTGMVPSRSPTRALHPLG